MGSALTSSQVTLVEVGRKTVSEATEMPPQTCPQTHISLNRYSKKGGFFLRKLGSYPN